MATALLAFAQDSQTPPYKPGNGVTPPATASRPLKGTTPLGIKLRAIGTVYFSVVVEPDGTAGEIKVTGPLGYGLDEQLVNAVRGWRFKPGTKDGVPVPVILNIGQGFRMCPNPAKTWCSGPMSFARQDGMTPPVVIDGAMPEPPLEPFDDSAIFEFTVDRKGAVSIVHKIEGSQAAMEVLPAWLSTWKFRPAVIGSQSVEATGRVRFIIGNGGGWNRPTPPPQSRPALPDAAPAIRTMVNEKDGQTYVWITPGNFTMGCSDGDSECSPNERPPRPVMIGNGFWLGRTLVTQAAWAKVVGGNPSRSRGDQLPVEQVTWNDASNYCSAIEGRLPTDAEFEYAARAGSRWSRYGNLDEIAWYKGNSGGATHPVAGKQANAFGLFDMLGNVWEWVADNYPGGTDKIARGGSVFADPQYSEAARKAKYSGTLLLSVVVDIDGKAQDIHVVKALGMGLDEKAIQAVKKWKFAPGARDGVPVKVRVAIEVNFRLF